MRGISSLEPSPSSPKMPPERRPRQDPVSCETCRRKKLKCDRDYPCSNCVSRGTTCIFAGKRNQAAPLRPSELDDTAALRSENAVIKERLEKLERIVLSGTPSSSESRQSSLRQAVLPSPAVSSPPETEATRGYREDFLWLEGVGNGENTRLPSLSPTFRIRIARIDEIVKSTINGFYHEHDIPLPTEEEAAVFVDVHTSRIDPGQHFTHVPTHKASFERLYDDLRNGRPVEPNRTVFLLSILASVAALWAFSPDDIPVYGNRQQALDSAYDWTRINLDVLEQVRRSGSATLETIQATMSLVFLLYHADGFSLKVRALHGSAISIAKELGLHRTDAPRNGLPLPKNQAEIVDRELRRRIWWHLACTDWSLGTAGGTQAGTYMISPRQMRVQKPRNVSDDELSAMPSDWERPQSAPTIMSYFMIRIKLGEISRRIADLDCMMELDQVSIDEIISIDDEFETALNDMPVFLRIDQQSLWKSSHLEAEHPHLPLQRYIVNIMLQARRCKFHGPFLLRAATDSSFAPFRLECLRSARAVIQARNDLSTSGNFVWLANTKLSGVLHLYFYAVVVLLIDLCVNRSAGDETARKTEIKEACRTLEEARHQSVPAGMFLDSLLAIMQKHRIRLQGQDGTTEGLPAAPAMPSAPFALASSGSANGELPSEYVPSMDFDEIWQSYTNLDFGDAQDWDALMRDLDFSQ